MDDQAQIDEWLYGPADATDDADGDVGEMYRRHEEEDRIRWIPGYRELVLAFLAALRAWHAAWVPGQEYPPQPETVSRLQARISEYQWMRPVPPWERKP